MKLSGYMNYLEETVLLALCHVMEYLMHRPHEPIMYSRNKIFKTSYSPLQYLFKLYKDEINQNHYYSKFIHSYCDADHPQDITDRLSVISTVHIFNDTIVDWCSMKQKETLRSNSNAETRSMYIGVVYQNFVRIFCCSIG